MKKRRPQKMLVLGLTGGIGMGKTTAARILNRMGLSVYNADHVVHDLLRKDGGAVRPIAKLFPASLKRGAIDRKKLGSLVFGKPEELRKLEGILHPLVHKAERVFLKKAKQDGANAVVLEIPLMYETGADKRCDFVICVTASRALQKERVMRRKGMTEAKYKAIVRRQMPDVQKRSLADYIVHTDTTYADTRKQLQTILETHHLIKASYA